MAVSDSDQKKLILAQVGDTESGPVGSLLGVLWQKYADKAQINPELQFLYARREAAELMLGKCQDEVTYQVDNERYELNKKIDRLMALRNDTQSEIERVELYVRKSRTPVTGAINQTAPVASPHPGGQPDANNRGYRGDAYQRSRTRPGIGWW